MVKISSQWGRWAAVAAIVAQPVVCGAASFESCLQGIHGSNASDLVLPSSSAYSSDRLGFNYAFTFNPRAIYYASSTKDAAAAVKCASQYNVTVAPRSGGHSYKGYCEGGTDGAFVIDLSLMQDFNIDAATAHVTYGAGHRLGQLYTKLWNAGKYFVPAGTCPTVGVGGHGLGGGIGVIARKYGMLTDNIVGMTFIDAQGEIKRVSASSNPDLFWALRGAGGGSFGLVTEFQVQAYKAPSVLTTIQTSYALANYAQVIDGYGKWGKGAPEDITTEVNLGTDGISMLGTFLGRKEEAEKVLAGLFELTGQPQSVDVNEQDWFDAATADAYLNNGTLADPVIGDARYARGRSLVYRSPMSQKERDIIFKYLSNPPQGGWANYIIIDIWGGKIDSPPSPSAFENHRGVLYSIEFVAEWGDSESPPGLAPCKPCLDWSLAFAREMQAAYSPGPLEAYQNYIEKDLPSYLEAYYGSLLPRLKSIKKAVDPRNLFRNPQSIPGE